MCDPKFHLCWKLNTSGMTFYSRPSGEFTVSFPMCAFQAAEEKNPVGRQEWRGAKVKYVCGQQSVKI